jgi:hypothetical protein
LAFTLTSPASRLALSVVIVCAETGCTERANPVISDVVTKPRRDQLVRGASPLDSNPSISSTASSPA